MVQERINPKKLKKIEELLNSTENLIQMFFAGWLS